MLAKFEGKRPHGCLLQTHATVASLATSRSPHPVMSFARLLDRFTAAVSGADAQGFAALFTAEGRYHDGFFGLHEGRQRIAAMLGRFHAGGEDFAWQFLEPLAVDDLGYARYLFSYRSLEPESAGRLIVFEGFARLRLRDGLIADYAEVFDRGVAFTQLGYAGPRVLKLLQRYAGELCDSEAAAAHRAWRDDARET